MLCPDIQGVIKKVKDNVWVHVACVNWMPEIEFKGKLLEEIKGEIPKKRFKLKCLKCMKSSGASIQCDYSRCGKSYHVRCA